MGEVLLVVLQSTNDEDGASEPEGLDSKHEEEYQNKKDPVEDRYVQLFSKKTLFWSITIIVIIVPKFGHLSIKLSLSYLGS